MWRHGLPPNDVGLLDRLAATGVPVPTPITTATIGGYPCALFAHVAGRHATDADRVAVAKAMRTSIERARTIDAPLVLWLARAVRDA